MATTALTQLQNHQHHHSQQLDFNLPVSSASGGGVSSSPVRSCSPTPSPVGIENFCKECGLAFESHTSLEVHLSYHRANLLSRWAAQDPNNSNSTPTVTAMDSKFQPKSEPQPPPPAPSHISPAYYDQHQVDSGHGHAQYNNTLPPEYQGSNGGNQQFPPPHRHHHLFPQDLPPGQQHYDSRHRNDPGSREKELRGVSGEEILDLDSNKVHIYNLPHQQQLQYLHPNSFYRPYLMTQPLPSPTNGNHPQLHHLPPPPPFPQEAQHLNHNIYKSHVSPPQRSPSNAHMSPYEFGHHQYPPPPQPMDHQSNPATYHQAPSSAHNFRGNFPPQKQPFPRDSNSPEPNLNSLNLIPGVTPVSLEGKKGKKTKVGPPQPPPLNGRNEDSNSPAPKTKGWKGGECKRPKTYNCTACNKWFTSSGHLKRHYGTTLHKNSLRQRGENPDDQPPVASGKKKKEMQLKRSLGENCSNGSGGDSNNEIDSSSSRSHLPNNTPANILKSEDSSAALGKSTGGPILSNGRGVPDFSHQGHHHAPSPVLPTTTSSYSNNPPTYLHVYHNGPQGPSSQPSYGGVPMGISPHAQFHPSFGYDGGPGLMTSSPNVYAVSVPTSMYGGGYPPTLLSSDIPGSQLPPFSTVLSPYDQQFGHHGITMTSNGPLYLQQGGVGPPPGSPPYDSESGIHSNSTTDGHEHLKNGESPEAVRSASSASGLEVSDDAEVMSDDGQTGSGSTGFSSGSESDPSLSLTPKPQPSSTTEGGLIKCSDCSKTFNRTCYLTQHTNSSHSGGKPFKCPTCGKRFPEAPALSDHVAKHGDNKPYKCELCPKQFNHKTDLRRHLCLHTGEKPFVCFVCGKGFIRKDHMTKHSETHRKVKSTPIQ